MAAPEITITLDRSDTRPLRIAFKSGVEATQAVDLTGSTFGLKVFDVLGDEVLSDAGIIQDGKVVFDLTLEERAQVPRGRNCRFEVNRSIGGNTEVWLRGTLNVIGGV